MSDVDIPDDIRLTVALDVTGPGDILIGMEDGMVWMVFDEDIRALKLNAETARAMGEHLIRCAEDSLRERTHTPPDGST